MTTRAQSKSDHGGPVPPPDPESDALHARARAFVKAFELHQSMPESFDALGSALARFQASRISGYARMCQAVGVNVAQLEGADRAPAVPTEAFRVTRVATFPAEHTSVTFKTSGTTSGLRGTHEVRDVATYDEAALAYGTWALRSDLASEVIPVLVIGPPPEDAPNSSLTHMIDGFCRAWSKASTPRESYFVDGDGVIDLGALDERIARAIVEDEPVLLLGTSFAFVHALDAIGDAVFRLPPRSRIMQTGGFKGRSREVEAGQLRRDLARVFAVEPRHIVSEYGMTELSSQFYEATIATETAETGVYIEPPWARVVPVDPATLDPVRHGEIGIARIEDLMNVDSAFAILTADRVRRKGAGFELLGRSEGAPPRGCSIGIDELMGRTSS